MYGHGNYTPQFGQSPNRPPRPPFMQQQVGSTPTGLIQQGPSVSPHGVAQPVVQQPHAISPFGSTYNSAPMTQSSSSTSTPTGQCYPPQATTGQNSTTGMHPLLSAQQSAHTAQYISPLLPPSSHSRVPPPPPPQNQNINRHPIHQHLPSLQQISVPHSALPLLPPPPMLPLQTSSVPPLPPSPPPFPPPPPSSLTLQPSLPVSKTINSDHVHSDCDPCFSQAVTPESEQNIVTHDTNRARDPNDASVEGGLSSMPSDTVDVPTPPARPTNEKTLRNIEILCQYISQNGPAFEDMARQKESGNPAFQFLFGGEPGSEAASEREYYLWMKNKLCPGQNKNNLLLKDNHEEDSSSAEPNKEASNPVTDSDMDMEDDIIQPCESGLKHEFDSSVDEIEKGNQNNLLESLQGSISTTYEEPAIDLGGDDEGRSNITACTKTQTEDPFKLLKDYSSDESSEVDASEPVSTLQFHEAIVVASDQCKTQDIDASLAHQIIANELISVPSSLENKSDIAVENIVRANSSKQSDFHDLEKMDALERTGVGLVSEIGKDQREPTKSSASLKVDEFGRLIREGASGTDSDDSRHYRRSGRRGRSRSPSRSPPKRRRRRSPRRRKERRSLSRSRSPKRRRSRSRSPLRRPIDSGFQKNARGRQQTGECFNFLKGRCYRGASCKYLHSDSDKHGESRQYRRKHHASETRISSRDNDHYEENKVTTRKGSPDNGSDKVKDKDLIANEKEHADSVYASKSSIVDEKLRAKDVSGLYISNLQKDKKPEQTMSRGNDEYEGHSQAESLNQASQISRVSSCLPSEAIISPCKNSVKIAGLGDLSYSNSTAFNYPNHVSHPQQPLRLPLLPPPPPPPLHAATMPRIPQPIQDYSSGHAQPNIPFPNQHNQFHPPQNMPWGNFPLQRPPYILTPPLHNGPASFQQGGLPVRIDPLMQSSLNTNPADLPIRPQVGNLQDTSMSMHGSDQPPRHVDSTHPGNHLRQPVAGSLDPTSDDPRINSLSSGTFPSSSLPHGNIPPLPTSSLGEANPNRVQYLAHGNFLSGEPSSSGFQNPPHFQQQQQPYRFYQAAGDNIRDPLHFSADLHKNSLSQITDTGSRITAHYNPYASTFDQPLDSKFKYDAFRQDNKTEKSHNLSSAPFEGQNIAYEASPVIPSPHSSKAGYQTLARSGEHQYDPLFDSIEPSAESLRKQVEQQDRAADNSDIILRLSGSVKGKKKVLGADSAATSSETDEFGETAHPEVIAVEARSQSNLNDSAEGSAGAVEINQVKREGKSTKNNDSRSMKLLKLALASFVKDMLKPSWRQGNMSKEAFKTIVKKTVEKVSGGMKGHRVPKSKEKIDQYIDRSQRKLTALVEGYVNKYAK